MGDNSRPGSSRVSMFSDDQEECKESILPRIRESTNAAVKAEECKESNLPGVHEDR